MKYLVCNADGIAIASFLVGSDAQWFVQHLKDRYGFDRYSIKRSI